MGGDPLPLTIYIASIIGILLNFFVLIMVFQFGSIRKQKYDRCKKIEKELNLKQHSELRYSRYAMKRFYFFMIFVFIVSWAIVLINFG